MATNRFIAGLGPERLHIARGKGELMDLRRDMYEAFGRVMASMPAITMIDAADVTGGGTTQTVGFSVDSEEEVLVGFAAFDDEYFTIPAAAATLDTEGKGTIAPGLGGSAALVVKTNSDGDFDCILSNPNDTKVYLACFPVYGGPALNCESTDTVEFFA